MAGQQGRVARSVGQIRSGHRLRLRRLAAATQAAGTVAEPWSGYCHGWAASALLDWEPREKRVFEQTTFGVGDQKGLLAACHARDVANIYGERFGDGQGSNDFEDIYPDVLWHYLKLYIKQQRIPIIADLDPGGRCGTTRSSPIASNTGPQAPRALHGADEPVGGRRRRCRPISSA